MKTPSPERTGMHASTRWLVYAVFIAVSFGQAAGKILAVDAADLGRLGQYRIDKALDRERDRLSKANLPDDEVAKRLAAKRRELNEKLRLQRPFLSGNDRSRWMAVRAIAENGNHEIEPFLEEPTWDSIDMVQHRGRDGELHQYSSKPPLLMVLIAGPYWLLMQLTGTTLGESPYELGRTLLLLLNGGALLTMLLSVARLVERLGTGDVDRLFAMAVASLGTQLSAFTPVLNNHLFAAAATAVACDLWLRLLQSESRSCRQSFAAGIATAFACACELPALSLVVLIGVSLFWKRPAETLKCYASGVAIVAVAFFATNYWAHDSLRPPYAHRSETDPADNWYDYEYTARGIERESYWRNRQGIDRGEPSQTVYAVHTLVGHHGVFSLTPIWLLSTASGLALLASRNPTRRQFAWATVAITTACLIFYIGLRPQDDRNYGGTASGFRWLFWLAPMWVALLPQAIDKLRGNRLGMGLAMAMLAWGVMSASYPTWNPWTHPWVYNWMAHLGFTVL